MKVTECPALPGMVMLRTAAGETLTITRRELSLIVQEAFDKFDICPSVWTDAAR